MNPNSIIFGLVYANGEVTWPDVDRDLFPAADDHVDPYVKGYFPVGNPTEADLAALFNADQWPKGVTHLIRIEGQAHRVERPRKLGQTVTITGKIVGLGAHQITVELP